MARSSVTLRFNDSALRAILQGPSGPVARDLAKKALFVESAAKQLAPVDLGRLMSSITHEITQDGQGLVAYIGSNVEYAIYQELGTRYMAAQPYLIPALSRLPR